MLNHTSPKKAFFDEVYSIVAQIPHGKVLSYGQIAKLAGKPTHSRMVGEAMRMTPNTLAIPCHRVVNSRGQTAPNLREQRSLLEKEGVTFCRGGYVKMKLHNWEIE